MGDTIIIKHDGQVDIATGRSRKETHWRNKEITWSAFVERISQTHRTAETLTEYMASKKTRQDEIKDVGGFVGGYVNNGRRKSDNILHRQLITLDLDFAKAGVWDDFKLMYDNAAAIYSTHKHSPEHPRLRLIMPIDRPVGSDEYIAIARRIAGNLDINIFDDTTFEPSRLMYWPSTAKDAEYVFEYQDGPWLSADEVLGSYKNWKDASEWPFSDRVGDIIRRDMKKQGDPLEKPGVVGAFCRVYNIHEAIEQFLSDEYEACDIEDRYTYRHGSTAGGLVVYDDKFAFSHHGTDPASGKLCNAFDLVRLHAFGLSDEDAREGTPGNKLPSYTAMVQLASKDSKVRKQIGIERLQDAKGDFEGKYADSEEEISTDWLGEMEVDAKGGYKSTINNIRLILDNDPAIKGSFALNRFEQREVALRDLPWRKVDKITSYLTDKDDAGLRHYLEKTYDIAGLQKVKDAMDLTVEANAFHPVRDYINGLSWDGEERIDTLYIDYLGAEDSDYTRAVTRKSIVAAIARVFRPGIKYDYVPVLIGTEGIGKSTIIKKLGRDWFSDSFSTVQGKEAFEQLQGVWIMEMAELAGLRKAEIEATKHFISKQEDRYRVAYGRRLENFPRQCVFVGTTNNDEFLRGDTGNRRFWPVLTRVTEPVKNVFEDLDQYEIDQVWAEAMVRYKAGEPLHLDAKLEAQARERQLEHSEKDDRTGIIQQWLDTPVPTDWSEMDTYERRNWYADRGMREQGTKLRDRISIAEIWCELFGKPQAEMNGYNTKDLHSIMRQLPGWTGSNNPIEVNQYGRQRVYRRAKNSVYRAGLGIHEQKKEGIQCIYKTYTKN